jgi:hypothetical protein
MAWRDELAATEPLCRSALLDAEHEDTSASSALLAPLLCLGEVELRRGHVSAAVATAERCTKLFDDEDPNWLLARAQWAGGRIALARDGSPSMREISTTEIPASTRCRRRSEVGWSRTDPPSASCQRRARSRIFPVRGAAVSIVA